MKERPILMSAPMVRAILSGAKAQTRRVIKPPPTEHIARDGRPMLRWHGSKFRGCQLWAEDFPATMAKMYCPHGRAGDRLWVREAFAIVDQSDYELCIRYKADERDDWWINPGAEQREKYTGARFDSRWRPGIHMPRWASRLTLEISGIRVERVQEISHEDVIAEGGPFGHSSTSDEDFAALWDSINEARGFGWQANPYVWVLTFRRIESERTVAA